MNKKVVEFCKNETGLSEEEVESVLVALLGFFYQEFSEGRSIDFGENVGVFAVKAHEHTLPPGSSRTQKQTTYSVVFKTGNALKKKLKDSIFQSDSDT